MNEVRITESPLVKTPEDIEVRPRPFGCLTRPEARILRAKAAL
jgi:hypothetical protein